MLYFPMLKHDVLIYLSTYCKLLLVLLNTKDISVGTCPNKFDYPYGVLIAELLVSILKQLFLVLLLFV